MGCGSSKKAQDTELNDNARPAAAAAAASTTTAAQAPANNVATQNTQQPVSGGVAAAKARRHPDNPIVYFDITIGGQFTCNHIVIRSNC